MIYDCFTFFNELDILEIRLHELDRVVDRFVLVEATRTHSNQPKPLYFKDNRERFAPWLDRIIHIVADDMPGGDDAWTREKHQRICIGHGLRKCTDDDTILISDLDEIPRAAAVQKVNQLTFLQQRLSYYFLNYATPEPWYGTRIIPFWLLRQMTNVQAVREAPPAYVVAQAGWHFSYTGGIERIRHKIQSFAHQEYNKQEFLDPDHLRAAITAGHDPYGRENQAFELVDLSTLPAWVVENRQRLAHLLWSEFHENWYPEDRCQALAATYSRVHSLIGSVIEIGCWEGKSAAVLANACYPDELQAVDTWQGNHDEDPAHVTIALAQKRDVHPTFLKNMRSLTLGNVRSHVMKSQDYFAQTNHPIKFCHIDASHDYQSVKREIAAALPRLIPMGVLCGDDFLTAGAHREDLQGGVERAVRELLPGFQTFGDFWCWQRPWAATHPSQPAHALNPVNLPQSQPYFDWPRDDVLQAIAGQGIKATQAVELGCSSGLFGAKLKAVLSLQSYIGIELDESAAAQAQSRLDKVHVANLEQALPAQLEIPANETDLLIALDVLEHLHNPWEVLGRWASILRPEGHVVASIPNIQNITVILNLIQGKWKYESAGLLDVTHLRFFTFEGVQQLFAGAGLKIVRSESVLQPPLDQSALMDTGNSFKFGSLALSDLSRQQVLQLFSYQFIVIAQKPAS